MSTDTADTSSAKEIPAKPYLLRALYEWCLDNGYTPHLTVRVDEHCRVPRGHTRDGQITFNIGALATHSLQIGNDYIEFQARFNGVAQQISVPVTAVAALYARETGNGMGFETESFNAVPTSTAADEAPAAPAKPSRPSFQLVK